MVLRSLCKRVTYDKIRAAMSRTIQVIIFVSLVAIIIGRQFWSTTAPPLHGNFFEGTKVVPALSFNSSKGGSGSLADYSGKWVIVFFGYMTCPDVCPITLAYLNNEYGQLLENQDAAQVVFISLDPERDKPELVNQYLANFNKDFVGLIGTRDVIDKITDSMGAFYDIHPIDSALKYAVDHTSDIFLINPAGELAAVYRGPHKKGVITEDLRTLILRGHS